MKSDIVETMYFHVEIILVAKSTQVQNLRHVRKRSKFSDN